MLNQFVEWCDVSERARSKSLACSGGTRSSRAIRPIACAAAGVKRLGWEGRFFASVALAVAKKVTATDKERANRPQANPGSDHKKNPYRP